MQWPNVTLLNHDYSFIFLRNTIISAVFYFVFLISEIQTCSSCICWAILVLTKSKTSWFDRTSQMPVETYKHSLHNAMQRHISININSKQWNFAFQRLNWFKQFGCRVSYSTFVKLELKFRTCFGSHTLVT